MIVRGNDHGVLDPERENLLEILWPLLLHREHNSSAGVLLGVRGQKHVLWRLGHASAERTGCGASRVVNAFAPVLKGRAITICAGCVLGRVVETRQRNLCVLWECDACAQSHSDRVVCFRPRRLLADAVLCHHGLLDKQGKPVEPVVMLRHGRAEQTPSGHCEVGCRPGRGGMVLATFGQDQRGPLAPAQGGFADTGAPSRCTECPPVIP